MSLKRGQRAFCVVLLFFCRLLVCFFAARLAPFLLHRYSCDSLQRGLHVIRNLWHRCLFFLGDVDRKIQGRRDWCDAMR